MTSGTSDTWWPGTFLESDLGVKTEGELVKVIRRGEAAPAAEKLTQITERLTCRSLLQGTFNPLLR